MRCKHLPLSVKPINIACWIESYPYQKLAAQLANVKDHKPTQTKSHQFHFLFPLAILPAIPSTVKLAANHDVDCNHFYSALLSFRISFELSQTLFWYMECCCLCDSGRASCSCCSETIWLAGRASGAGTPLPD